MLYNQVCHEDTHYAGAEVLDNYLVFYWILCSYGKIIHFENASSNAVNGRLSNIELQ